MGFTLVAEPIRHNRFKTPNADHRQIEIEKELTILFWCRHLAQTFRGVSNRCRIHKTLFIACWPKSSDDTSPRSVERSTQGIKKQHYRSLPFWKIIDRLPVNMRILVPQFPFAIRGAPFDRDKVGPATLEHNSGRLTEPLSSRQTGRMREVEIELLRPTRCRDGRIAGTKVQYRHRRRWLVFAETAERVAHIENIVAYEREPIPQGERSKDRRRHIKLYGSEKPLVRRPNAKSINHCFGNQVNQEVYRD